METELTAGACNMLCASGTSPFTAGIVDFGCAGDKSHSDGAWEPSADGTLRWRGGVGPELAPAHGFFYAPGVVVYYRHVTIRVRRR